MPKKLVFALVFLFLLCGLSVSVILGRDKARQFRFCEISEFLFQEKKLLQSQTRQEISDSFFWRYYGEKQFSITEIELQRLQSKLKVENCSADPEIVSSWLFGLSPDIQEQFIQFQFDAKAIHADFYRQISLLKNKKQKDFLEIQEDLEKFRFHVQQLQRGDSPRHILEKACRSPASVMNSKKQHSCKKALVLTKEFRVKDERNLENNRRILFQKWVEFKDWIDSAVAEIEQGGEDSESIRREGE